MTYRIWCVHHGVQLGAGDLQTNDIQQSLSWKSLIVLGPLPKCHCGGVLRQCVNHINFPS